MAVDEQKLRRSLHDRLEAALGADEAALLMEYLPPVGWADIATKTDLDHLAMMTKHDLEAANAKLEVAIAKLEVAIANIESHLLRWIIPVVIGSIGVSVTLAGVA